MRAKWISGRFGIDKLTLSQRFPISAEVYWDESGYKFTVFGYRQERHFLSAQAAKDAAETILRDALAEALSAMPEKAGHGES